MHDNRIVTESLLEKIINKARHMWRGGAANKTAKKQNYYVLGTQPAVAGSHRPQLNCVIVIIIIFNFIMYKFENI